MQTKLLPIFYTRWMIVFLLPILFIGCKRAIELEGVQALCPIIIATDPMNKAIDVDYDKSIKITFNTQMDSTSIHDNSFYILYNKTGATLSGKIKTTTDQAIYLFTPETPLLAYANYTLIIKKSVTSSFKIPMEADYNSSFTTKPSLELLSSNFETGNVIGGGDFAFGSKVAISAVPLKGFVFVNWTETSQNTIISTSQNLIYVLKGNHTLTANFIPILPGKYSISISSNPPSGGTTSGSGAYEANTSIAVAANPNEGYSFDNWHENGHIYSLDKSFLIEAIGTNRTFVANFLANPLSLLTVTLSANPILAGNVTGGGTYVMGTSISIHASQVGGYEFINWTEQNSGDIVSTSPNFTFVLNSNRNLIANYLSQKYTLNISSVNGTILKSPNQQDYSYGTSVQITAVPTSGYSFTSWSGDASSINNPWTFIMNANRNITANYTAIPPATYTLNTSSDNGQVTKNPNLVSYKVGSTVQLTAIPEPGYVFDTWGADTIAKINPVNIWMNKNKSITAKFNIIPPVNYTVNTIAMNGSVAISPIQPNYNSGTNIQLTATPNTGYTFTSWSGDTSSTSNPIIITINKDKIITANFTAIPITSFTLNITSNNGLVLKTPALDAYNSGTSVELTATPNAGYTFSAWSGDAAGATNPLVVSMTANKNIVAVFTAIPIPTFTLNTSATNGTITKTPNQTSYNSGTSVQLTATPNAGYTFSAWSGDAAGATNPLVVSMTANKNIVAVFTAIPIPTFTLNTSATNGTITKTPNQTSYNSGTSVQLTATPNAGYTFSAWSGDAAGATNPLLVSMTANKNIVAVFTAIPIPVTLGSIVNFGAYGGNAGLTNQGVHTVIHNGAIGTTSAPTLITGFHDGITGATYTETPLNIGDVTNGIYTAPPAPGTNASFTTASNALSDANTAYLSMSPTSKPGGTDPGGGELGGLTLLPGIYKSSIATFKITNQDLRLDAQGNPNAYWIFQCSAGLTVGTPAAPRNVILTGGAQAKNIFWYVGSAAVINYAGGGTMVGTIIATAGVTLSSPANSTTTSAQTILNGRAISLVASVTMVNTIINNQ